MLGRLLARSPSKGLSVLCLICEVVEVGLLERAFAGSAVGVVSFGYLDRASESNRLHL